MNKNTTFARRIVLGAGMLAASTLSLGALASSATAQTTTNSNTTTAQGQTGRGPGGHGGQKLTDTQKACLTGKGIQLRNKPERNSNASSTATTNSRPARSTDSSADKPAKPTAEQKAAAEAAAKECGITVPTKDSSKSSPARPARA